ncbi:hypothetical protein GIB67_001373 [Kingdonia uniflora]|uniref:Jacalin-type lectin domain-containing protein n=1 Tax=Kingdonia uniflora TaxID=39325 RepID=A0A7J7N7B9_9MAGN|nr:hypothetical protein GIB67_001373 [Kingdonia uniflora]
MDCYEYEKNQISVGPWGGQGGTMFDDGLNTTIRQMVIGHGPGIDSIQTEYDREGSSVWSGKHGGVGGAKVDKIKLDFPHEYLTTVSGYYGSIKSGDTIFILSLTLQTNKQKYGPFGTNQGTYFSFPTTGGMIVGFHGSSGWYLDSIGVYLKPLKKPYPCKVRFADFSGTRDTSSTSEGDPNHKLVSFPSSTTTVGGSMSYGPWGGNGGTAFDDGVYTGVRQLNLTRTSGIVSMKVLYDRDGRSIWGYKNGGTGAVKSDKIVFDFPFEVLTHITGYMGSLMYMGPKVIKSLTFHTTKKTYGPYGDEQGIPFSSNLREGRIVGFFGRNGWYIDCIGVHVVEGKVCTPQPSKDVAVGLNNGGTAMVYARSWANKLSPPKIGWNEEAPYGVIKESAPQGPGPWGGDGGRVWDDGVFCGIKQIYMTRGDYINSIQIEYDRNGQSVWSVRHGAAGEAIHQIILDYPHEIVTCVSGYYSSMVRDEGHKVIRSLTIYTSRGKYGPFGEEIGTFFTSAVTEGKVVGFHGRSSLYLDAIGVHMQHWLGEQKTGKSIMSKIFREPRYIY